VTAHSSTTASSVTAVRDVTLPRPAGVVDGDILIASITADNAPSMSSVPVAWTPVPSTPVAAGGGARVFVYYHVVTSAAAEPVDFAWQLSAAQKWGAVLGTFRGVDLTTPFDTAPVTAADATFAADVLTLSGVTTTTAGAMLVGGVGLDSSAAGLAPPADWTKLTESSGAQAAALAHRSIAVAGPTGQATWGLPKKTASAGWLLALHPAR
jgi:hypothetical protein